MDTKFSVAVHILIMFSESKEKLTSEKIAKSVNTNASYIRKVIAQLKNAQILVREKGTFDYYLARDKSSITLLDIYKAVDTQKKLFVHDKSNLACPVGANINAVLDPIVDEAEKQLENSLAKKTLAQVIESIKEKIVK